jgi:hypothetical protein
VFRHQIGFRVGDLEAVCNRRAARKRRRADRRTRMGMDPDTFSSPLRFVARSVDLRVAQGLAAALADAFRCKDLDQIRAVGHRFSDELPNLIGGQIRVDQLVDGGQKARAGQSPLDCSPQRDIPRRADALNGRESGHQHRVGHLGVMSACSAGVSPGV